MINKLAIRNFRCFQNIFLEDIGQVNIFTGENSVGKSTLLEAIHFLFLYSSVRDLSGMASLRTAYLENCISELFWNPLFFNLDNQRRIEISCQDENAAKTSLFLEIDDNFNATQTLPLPILGQEQSLTSSIRVLKIDWHSPDGEAHGYILPNQNDRKGDRKIPYIHWIVPPNYNKLQIQAISPNFIPMDPMSSARQFGQVQLANRKALLLENMRLLDPSICDALTILTGDIVHVYIKFENGNLFPLASLGDGHNRLFTILCNMLNSQNKIFIFDEIESGFHYSFYPQLWKIIKNLVDNLQCQIFVSTHNYECIQEAIHVFSKNEEDRSMMRYIRLDRKGEHIEPHVFFAS